MPREFTETDTIKAVAAAKHELAVKVQAAIDGEKLHDGLDDRGDVAYMQAIEDVTNAVRQVLTDAGVAVEQEG
jgi:hypothetical protein